MLLTCQVTVFDEEGSDVDILMSQSDLFKQLKIKSVELCEMPRLANGLSTNMNARKKAMEIQQITSASKLCYAACSLLNHQAHLKQSLLEIEELKARMEKVLELLSLEMNLLKKENQELEKDNKSTMITQQLDQKTGLVPKKANPFMASNPFSRGSGKNNDEIENLRKRLEELNLPEETQKIVEQEMSKVERMSPQNSEYHVSINYLQTIADLPWQVYDPEEIDPQKAREILDRDHFGLETVKKRIIQHLAIRKLNKNHSATILCFFGPPGVGKTSLGKSIAEAMGRKFYRISLGGVRDEAEIRGHRRTYIGSMPGVIIQSLKKIKTSNPLFLLDEIDKVGRDHRGDPSSALLEVLDPNQNDKFTDHFLGTPFDLSKIMFIATANSLETIHPALLDRMEIIEIYGYSIKEKVQIAKKYLIPKQIKDNGINDNIIQFEDSEVENIIVQYTCESGVRSLERAIGGIVRQVAYEYAMSKEPADFYKVTVSKPLITEAIGNPKFDFNLNERITRPGCAIGLAYTEVGGRALLIETTKYPGTGQLNLTGKLGDVMKESVNTGLSWIKTNARKLGILQSLGRVVVDVDDQATQQRERQISEMIFKKFDIHVHFPAAAIPKDGPSAGITITTALVSLMTNRRVKKNIAMTGEISLQGLVLPVGGIKEKVMAAHRNNITLVILPEKNKKDADEIPQDIKDKIEIVYVSRVEEAIQKALEDKVEENLEQEILFLPKL